MIAKWSSDNDTLCGSKSRLLWTLKLGSVLRRRDTGPKGWRAAFGLFLVLLLPPVYAGEGDSHAYGENLVGAAERAPLTNTVCPVMVGNKVDPQIFSDYEGKRVYFCCLNCKSDFEKNPQKYVGRLPQFGRTSVGPDHARHDHSVQAALAGLVKPAGITTLTLLFATALAGLLRRKKPKFLLKWHKRLAVTTLVLAIIHVTLVLTAH